MRVRRTAAALTLATAAVLGTTAAVPDPAAPAGASAAGARSRFPTGTTTAADGRTVLTDPGGRTLQLRGFNVDKYDETTEGDLRSIAAHGFTLIRVAVSWTRLEPARGSYDRAELTKLHHLLDWAEKYGLLAVIDFHQDVYGPKFGGGDRGIPLWATRDDGLPFTPDPDDWFAGYFQPAVQAAFRHLYDDPDLRRWQTDFYTRIARELGGHRALLGYDLFNEPFGPVDGDPSDPAVLAASAAELEQGRLAGMYQRLISAIRRVDARSWLFVEPTVLVGQGVPTRLPAFSDPRGGAPRLGYAPHFYDTAVEAGRDWDPSDGFIENYTAAITAYPRANRLPVLVGEWGPPDARTLGNTELVRRQVAAMTGFADAWTMWYWCRGDGGYCALGPDGRPAPGNGPAFGPYAAALAGRPVSESYQDGVYRLAFTTGRPGAPGAGWTDVVLPAGSYPGRARVSVSGARASAVVVEQPGTERSGLARVLLPHTAPDTRITLVIS
ncbi:cellulase family glycosylhydrolase [Saccharothrix sp. ST-888]|uniref:cellulase family glycosylhydrolase n=1 Tax=Saccharothrix sp. ST-888 TaxID=1427391 RepID=UPI0005ECE219|nr:cellulase family glycosylhydrolase [Saccharothrix sp. ST-888]